MTNLTVGVTVREQLREPFAAFLSRHRESSLREPGCVRFDVLHDRVAAPCRWALVEQWADHQSLIDHRASAHYRHWRAILPYYETSHERVEWSGSADRVALASSAAVVRSTGARIVWANGCFDLLGHHHVRLLAEARRQGDWLAVGVNDDASVRELKGTGRPVRHLADRVELLAALRSVDAVVPYGSEAELDGLLGELRPDVMVKGADWWGIPLTGQQYAGRVHWCSLIHGASTTNTISLLRGAPKLEPRGHLDAVVPDGNVGRAVVLAHR